jgi:alpha-L-fucosidase 2
MYEKYNLEWNTPSQDYNGSMPIGNGETGLNVWVEPSGQVKLFISRTDSWDETERLCKIGGGFIEYFPVIDSEKGNFSQILDLERGCIDIRYQIEEQSYFLSIWVDAHHQCVNFEFENSEAISAEIILYNWRDQKRRLHKDEFFFLNDSKGEYYSWPDVILDVEDALCWYHQNQSSTWEYSLKLQYLEGLINNQEDPLRNRIFGGKISGDGFKKVDNHKLKLADPRQSFHFQISTLTLPKVGDAESWIFEIEKLCATHQQLDLQKARKDHEKWWADFWNRSWIFIEGFDKAFELTQNYILQRWMTACAGRGNYAIKFNGSIFTVNTAKYDPDYRRWGGWYWFQNTRFPYWPLYATGDWEMMSPFFDLYLNTRELAKFRNKKYYDHEGWFFPETMSFWGTYVNQNFGLDQTGKEAGDPIENQYIRWHFNATLEFLAMMLDFYLYTDDETFLNEKLLPTADDFLTWWRDHWTYDRDGKLLMEPSQSLETYWGIKNSTADIAGLQWCLDELLNLSDEEITAERRQQWTKFRSKIPEIPLMTVRKWFKKFQSIAPCEKPIVRRTNCESPRIYPIFPFRLYGLHSDPADLQLAVNTFRNRANKNYHGWGYDDSTAALLGLTNEVKRMILERAFNKHKESRFPAFWGPNYDWIPDQTHGGNLMLALQYMLLQPDREKIRLLPAWPKGWDVSFKLHGSHKTIVICKFENGKITQLEISPQGREKNILLEI